MNRLIILSAIAVLAAACTRSKQEETRAAAPETDLPAAPDSPAAQTTTETAAEKAPAEKAPAAQATNLGPAPDFTLKDLDGKQVFLSQLKGKTVVLEWFNPGCPFVQYAHGKGPLADMAAAHTQRGVVWLAINSGAPGKQGHGVDTNKKAAQEWKMTHPVLIDETGQVGKAYGAKTTPHMFIIDADGNLVYRGGLDNAPRGEAEGERMHYTSMALAALAAGQPIDPAETKPYGCSVKYAD